eukprot:4815820-Amphidinium_carterae.1
MSVQSLRDAPVCEPANVPTHAASSPPRQLPDSTLLAEPCYHASVFAFARASLRLRQPWTVPRFPNPCAQARLAVDFPRAWHTEVPPWQLPGQPPEAQRPSPHMHCARQGELSCTSCPQPASAAPVFAGLPQFHRDVQATSICETLLSTIQIVYA